MPPIPGPDVFDLRREPVQMQRDIPPDPTPLEDLETLFAASNNWAVSARHTVNGGAIVANDMHLRLGVPNTWYRASWIVPEEGGHPAAGDPSRPRQITGATLPGAPSMVIGSNGKIAWSLTNSGGNWSDLIEVEVDPTNPDVYRTPEGKRSFERHREWINIKGQPAEPLEILSTIWGPIIDHDHKKRPRFTLGRPRPGRREPEHHPDDDCSFGRRGPGAGSHVRRASCQSGRGRRSGPHRLDDHGADPPPDRRGRQPVPAPRTRPGGDFTGLLRCGRSTTHR